MYKKHISFYEPLILNESHVNSIYKINIVPIKIHFLQMTSKRIEWIFYTCTKRNLSHLIT